MTDTKSIICSILANSVLLERPPLAQPLKNFSTIDGTEGSLPCSQELCTGSYPELDEDSAYHPILIADINNYNR
jgi:hypothetical protein